MKLPNPGRIARRRRGPRLPVASTLKASDWLNP